MSRADLAALGAGLPTLGAAVRSSVAEFYFHSIRLVPANIVWGVVLIGALMVGLAWPLGGLLLAVLLALPTAGIYRLAALSARAEDVVLSDAWRAVGTFGRQALALGAVAVIGTTILVVNLVTALTTIGGPVGWAIATAAGWGLIGGWAWLMAVWPLVVDPRREGIGLRAKGRLAALILLAYPGRTIALVLTTLVLVVISAVAFAALVTITIAFVALVGCRYVLPAADRLEGSFATTA